MRARFAPTPTRRFLAGATVVLAVLLLFFAVSGPEEPGVPFAARHAAKAPGHASADHESEDAPTRAVEAFRTSEEPPTDTPSLVAPQRPRGSCARRSRFERQRAQRLRALAGRLRALREGKEPSEAVALLVEAESLSALEVEILLGRVARDPVPSTASILDSGVDDGRARVRALFLASLTSVAPERGLVRAAALAWSDPDPSLRRLGLRSLGRLATPEAMGVLAEIARAEFDPEMAELARRILALAQEESSAPAGR